MNTGSRLGPYEILAPLGAGGMGEVYRARDTRLHRDVAIKILPATFANDPERLARFEREAQVLAALNHPHIAHLYGLETGDAVSSPAIVMELVEGPTVADKLASVRTTSGKHLPIDETLAIARQVADALEAAHERGIIHRDLKPANIKVRPDGTVKVLDFGLANWPGAAVEGDPLNSPTITSPVMTAHGAILGTAAYMAPEQAKGQPVDKRADIWAFGCVLFEMLTGTRTFGGDSISETLAGVIKDAPDWSALPSTTPDALRRLLHRCLEKQPRRRLHDIADARIEIEALIESPHASTITTQPIVAPSGRLREGVAWTVAALSAAVAAWLAVAGRVPASSTALERVSLVHRVEAGAVFGAPQISPAGRRVVYSAEDTDGAVRVWRRSLDAFDATPLAGTESQNPGGNDPFWSPDSRSIAFFAAGKLKRMSADGGPAQSIADVANGSGGAWSANNVILFSRDLSGLFQIPADGGTPRQVTSLPTNGVWAHMWPSFLPDGRRFLFTARALNQPFDTNDSGIFLGSLDESSVRRLLPDVSSAAYAEPGFILFARDGMLTAVPFDAAAGRIAGEPFSLGEKVTSDTIRYQAAFSVSRTGTIALRQALPFEDLAQPKWLTRQGVLVGDVGDARAISSGVPSPSGDQVALAVTDPRTGNSDVWISDARGASLRRLAASREWEGFPIWSPDEARVAYTASHGSNASIRIQDVAGGEASVLIEATGQAFLQAVAWSPQQDSLLFLRKEAGADQSDLYVWSFASKRATTFLATAANEFMGTFSPDGRWVAYLALSPDAMELWTVRFPGGGDRRRLASDFFPMSWSRDGREIVGQTSGGHITALPVTVGRAGVAAGSPTILIRAPNDFGPRVAAVADHSRFLVGSRPDPEKGAAEIRIVKGLLDGLRPGRQP